MNVGITFGSFDLLHAGHVTMLKQAFQECDKLIVGLQSDPTIDRPDTKSKPIQTMVERYVQLDAVLRGGQPIYEIIPYQTESDIIDILYLYTPNKRFLGSEYINNDFTGKEVCEQLKIEVIHFNRWHRFSSSELRKRIYIGG